MAKFIRHDFGAIHEALNKLIIAEVKTALMELPEQEIEGPSLCRIVVSDGDDYEPKDVAVDRVWLHKDRLYFYGHIMPLPDDGNIEPGEFEGGEGDEETIETDWLDITDFGYLIDQIAQKVEEDKTVYIVNKRIAACEIAPEFDLGTAIHRTI
jgi:hypothetical protein